MKFRIINPNSSNANFDWKKRKKPKPPKVEKAIPDRDLCLQKGDSYEQAEKAYIDYRFKGKPLGISEPHV